MNSDKLESINSSFKVSLEFENRQDKNQIIIWEQNIIELNMFSSNKDYMIIFEYFMK